MRGAKLIVLPELFNSGYRVEPKDRELFEALTGAPTTRLQMLAKNLTHTLRVLFSNAAQAKNFSTRR